MTMDEARRGGKTYWRTIGWGVALALLLLPLVAMQFTREVNWTARDFVTMGALIGLAGLALEYALSRGRDRFYRLGFGLAIVTSFLLVWVNLAVGVIGTERNPANILYAAVLAIVAGGTIAARARPAGMAAALVVAAVAQAGIALFALADGTGGQDPGFPADVIGVSLLFVLLWLAAAYLLRHSAALESAVKQA